LGFKVEQQGGRREDLILSYESREARVEIKGKTKGFSLRDLRQLGHYLEDAMLDGKEVKGIFVGNHFRSLNPSKRGDPFPLNVLEYAARRSISLVTSDSLYGAICGIRNGRIERSDIAESLFEGEGLVSFPS